MIYIEQAKNFFVETINRFSHSDFVKKVFGTIVTKFFLIGLGLLVSVVISRILGPVGRGEYALALTVGAIGIQLLNFGLPASNIYYVAKDRTLLSTLVSNSIVVSFIFATVLVCICWGVFLICPAVAPISGILLLLSLIYVPLGLAYSLLQNLLLGIQEVRRYNLLEIAAKILGAGLLVLLIVVKIVNVETVFTTSIIVLCAGTAWILWWLKSHFDIIYSPSWVLFRQNLSYGIKPYVASLFALISTRADLILINSFRGPEFVGYYSIASTIADLPSMVIVTIGSILFPKLSFKDDVMEKLRATKQTAIYSCIIMTMIIIALELIGRYLITGLYGKAFLPAVPILQWLLLGLIPLPFTNAYAQLLAAEGNSFYYPVAWAVALMAKVLISYYLLASGALEYLGLGNFVVYVIVLVVTIKALEVKRGVTTRNG